MSATRAVLAVLLAGSLVLGAGPTIGAELFAPLTPQDIADAIAWGRRGDAVPSAVLPPAFAVQPTRHLDDVLARARGYVTRYEIALQTVIAEEHYLQRVLAPPRNMIPEGPTLESGGVRLPETSDSERRLRSEFMMVRVPADGQWLAFRDVNMVDGRAIPDRKARLERLSRASASPTSTTEAGTCGSRVG